MIKLITNITGSMIGIRRNPLEIRVESGTTGEILHRYDRFYNYLDRLVRWNDGRIMFVCSDWIKEI